MNIAKVMPYANRVNIAAMPYANRVNFGNVEPVENLNPNSSAQEKHVKVDSRYRNNFYSGPPVQSCIYEWSKKYSKLLEGTPIYLHFTTTEIVEDGRRRDDATTYPKFVISLKTGEDKKEIYSAIGSYHLCDAWCMRRYDGSAFDDEENLEKCINGLLEVYELGKKEGRGQV